VRLRWLVFLLVVLGGLGGLLFAERMHDQPGAPVSFPLVRLDPGDVTRVVIEGPKGRTALEDVQDRWRLTEPVDYPADPELVKRTLALLSDLNSDGVISTNPDKAGLFEVDDAHAVKVALYQADDADPKVRLVVGKLAPGFTHTYVKLGDDPKVHEVPGALRFQLERDATGWRDKTVLAFDPAAIDGLTLAGAHTVTVKRGDKGWTWGPDAAGTGTPTTGAPSTDAVERLVKALSVLHAQGFEDTPPEAPAKPLLTVTLARPDDQSPIDLVVEAEEGTRYRVVAEANPQRFLIDKSLLEPYVKDPSAALAAADKAAPASAKASEPAQAPAAAPAPASGPAPAPAG